MSDETQQSGGKGGKVGAWLAHAQEVAAEQAQQRQAARQAQQASSVCQCCGEKLGMSAKECPVCTTPRGASAPTQKQLIRTYDAKNSPKGDIDKAFREDAARLARGGWRVQSQSYGGNASVGLATFALHGLRSERKAKEMTVIYTHD